MQQSSRRFLSMVLSLAFIVGAFLVFFEMVQPAYGTLEDLKGQQLSNEQLLQNEQTIVTQVKKLISQSQSDQGAVSDLALAMPTGPDIAGAVAQIYGIAQQNGITVTSIGVTPPRATVRTAAEASSTLLKAQGTIGLQIAGSGTYEALKGFLSQLETNIRVFDVTALSITPVAQAATGGKPASPIDLFTYSVSATTYYQLP